MYSMSAINKWISASGFYKCIWHNVKINEFIINEIKYSILHDSKPARFMLRVSRVRTFENEVSKLYLL